jgi:precorrin-4 methylase
MAESSYETKFKTFIDMCNQAKEKGADVVIIHHPEVLGDDYSEIIESLDRLSAAELKLLIVPPDARGAAK